MGRLILCRGKTAEKPFYIESASLFVYSAEELSYYIIHNLDFIDEGIYDSSLCRWLDEEVGMSQLSYKLTEILQKGKGIARFMSTFLEYVGYATRQEMEAVNRNLKVLENKSPQELVKIKADKLVSKGKYSAAIEAYQDILNNEEPPESILKGNVYHNMGTAYARLYLYEAAAECYHQAYQLNQNPESLQEYMHAVRYVCDDAGYGENVMALDERKSQELVMQLTHILQSEEAHIEKAVFYRLMDFQKSGDFDSFFKLLDEQIEQWKQSYLSMTQRQQ